MSDEDQLREQIMRMRPWHLDVEVTPGLSTAVSREDADQPGDEHVTFIDRRMGWRELIDLIYPNGLEGRSFLDCACNCGGYSFWAKELGARRCLGFDVREHWIDQARFLAEAREEPSEGIEFALTDLYDLPDLVGQEQFDVTLFKGIFYHLPDPITGLKLAADRTRELLILNTATKSDLPDGLMAVAREGTDRPMSGVYGLNWLPTGPKVLQEILDYLGFAATRLVHWTPNTRKDRGRLQIIAARDESLFERYDSRQASAEPFDAEV